MTDRPLTFKGAPIIWDHERDTVFLYPWPFRLWQIPCQRCVGIGEIGDRVCRLCAGSGIYLMTRDKFLEWFDGEMAAGREVHTEGNRIWRRYGYTNVTTRRPASLEITG